MFPDFDNPWLAFTIFLLTWHVLGPRVLQGRSRIPSPDLQDVINTLAALLCWSYLFYPSPLFWFLVFTFLKKRITLSQPSISQRRPQSGPITKINLPVHALTSQFPPKDSTRLLKDLLRSPILLPSFPGMQSTYQPIAKPIALLNNSGTMPIFRPTTGNDGRVSTMTRFDEDKQPVGNPLHTASNFEALPILTYTCQEPQLANSASKASVLGKRKRTDQNSSRMRTQPMAGALDITPPVESGKRRKVDGVVPLTSTSAVGKE